MNRPHCIHMRILSVVRSPYLSQQCPFSLSQHSSSRYHYRQGRSIHIGYLINGSLSSMPYHSPYERSCTRFVSSASSPASDFTPPSSETESSSTRLSSKDLHSAGSDSHKKRKSAAFHVRERFIFSSVSPHTIASKVVSALLPGHEIPDSQNISPKLLKKLNIKFNPNKITWTSAKDTHKLGHVTKPLKVIASEFGNGIAVDEFGWIHLIRGANVGDTIVAQVEMSVHGCCKSQVLEIVEKSPETETPKCRHFYECDGCQFQHVSYQKELEAKRQYVQNLLLNNAYQLGSTPDKIRNLTDHPILPAPRQYGYKEVLHVEIPELEEGEILSHVFLPGAKIPFQYTTFDLQNCEILDPALQDEYQRFRDRWIGKENITEMQLYRQNLTFRKSLAFPSDEKRLSEFIWQRRKLMKQLRKSKKSQDQDSKNVASDTLLQESGLSWSPAVVSSGDKLLQDVQGTVFMVPGLWQVCYNSDTAAQIINHLRFMIQMQRKYLSATASKLQNLMVLQSGYGFYPILLSELFERVLGLNQNMESYRMSYRNASFNGKKKNIDLEIVTQNNIFDVANVAFEYAFDSDQTVAVVDPTKDGLSPMNLRNLVLYGPKVIMYVSNSLESHIYDLMYLTGGESRSESEKPGPHHDRFSILLQREHDRHQAVFTGSAVAHRERLDFSFMAAKLSKDRVFDSIGEEVREYVRKSPEGEGLLEFANPGACYRLVHIRTIDSNPRTKRSTTIFTLIRQNQ